MNVKKLTDRRKDLIYLITYIGYASIYMNRINLSMAGPDLKSAGILTTAQLGFLGTAFSVVYATGRLFNSMLADTMEPRTMIGIGLFTTGLAGLFVGALPPFAGILLLWCVNAFAQSMLWASVLRIITSMYSDDAKRTARLSSVVSTVAAGQVAGILFSLLFLNNLGLRWAFILPGLFTFAMALTVFLTYPLVDGGKEDPGVAQKAQKKKAKIENPFRRMAELMKIPEVRLAMIPSAFMGLMKDNATLWMTVYFVDTYGIDLNATTGFVLFIPLVGLGARLLFPVFLKLAKNNEHLVSLYTFAGSLVASVLLVTVKNSLVAVICLSMVYACMSLTNSSMLSIFPARYAARGCMAAISGVLDFVAYLGAGLGSTVFGLTIDTFGYGFMYASWAVMSVAGFLIMQKLLRVQKNTAAYQRKTKHSNR